MKLKKGSKAAKDFMAKLRAARGTAKKYAAKASKGIETAKKHAATAKRKYKAVKSALLSGEKHQDVKSHNYTISISGVKLSSEEKKFIELEGRKSKGYKYRAKVLWGDWIVLKEKQDGQPVQKWIVDSYEVASFIAQQLNKGQKYTKVKSKKIK